MRFVFLFLLLTSFYVYSSSSSSVTSRRGFVSQNKAPSGWTKIPSGCTISSVYLKRACFNLRSCSNSFTSINNQNITNLPDDNCEECVGIPSSNIFNSTNCYDLIETKRAGKCCYHQHHCCVETYDLCSNDGQIGTNLTGANLTGANSTICNRRCISSINSYSCTVVRDTCFNMTVTITGSPSLPSVTTNENQTLSVTFYPKCNTNDINCMDLNIGTWGNYSNINCWYRFNDNTTVPEFRFSNPCYDNSSDNSLCKERLDSLDIFLIVAGCILGGLLIIILTLFIYKRTCTRRVPDDFGTFTTPVFTVSSDEEVDNYILEGTTVTPVPEVYYS